MSLDTAVPRSKNGPPLALALAATAGALLLLIGSAAAPVGAQDTLRPPDTPGAAPTTLGQARSAPAVRVSLGDEALVPGDRGRVSVRTRADGYVVVLHADPAGRIRVLFPLDPGDDQAVRADSDLVVRSRGGGRDAFTAGSALGDGMVLAAFSASRPFGAGRFARNGHWDPRTFPHVTTGADAEGELLALAGDLLPRGARFDYDVATYRVSEPLSASAPAAAAGEEEGGYAQDATATDSDRAANAYDGNVPMGGAGGYYGSLYDPYFGGYLNGYFGGLFPIVVVLPGSFHGVSRPLHRGFYRVGFDPFFLSLGCPPVFYSPYGPFPHYGGRYAGKYGGYGVVYSGPRSIGRYLNGSTPPASRTPYSSKSRRPATGTTTGPTTWRSRGGESPTQGGVATSEPRRPTTSTPSGWTPMTWRSMTEARRGPPAASGGSRRDPVQVWRGTPAPTRSRPTAGSAPTATWRAPARGAPASAGAARVNGGGARVASPGGARGRPR